MRMENSECEMNSFWPMRNIVPLRLFVRMMSSGVVFIFAATRGQDVAAAHNVFLFVGGRIIGRQDADVDVAEQILRFTDVFTVGIFLNQGD